MFSGLYFYQCINLGISLLSVCLTGKTFLKFYVIFWPFLRILFWLLCKLLSVHLSVSWQNFFLSERLRNFKYLMLFCISSYNLHQVKRLFSFNIQALQDLGGVDCFWLTEVESWKIVAFKWSFEQIKIKIKIFPSWHKDLEGPNAFWSI